MMNTNITDAAIRLVPQGNAKTEKVSTPQPDTGSSVTELALQNPSKNLSEVSADTTVEQSEILEDSVNALNKVVQSIERDLQFSVDDSSGKTVVTVLDTKTEEVIRQIPAEHVLAFAESVDNLKGLLFSVEV